MPTIGFLHTADVHVDTFRSLVAQRSSEVEVVEIVDTELLARASIDGAAAVSADVAVAVDQLRERGADLVVCTCSTLGGIAEGTGGDVVRVDRPMARQAIASGRPLSVVVAVDATVEPTLALLAEESSAIGADPDIEVVAVPEAWTRFLEGDTEEYLDTLASEIDRIPAERVVVLAQGSMAALVERFGGREVLASPMLAVEASLARLAGDG